jgi:phenylalanyl-tRNA synthetase beta chain
MKILSKWLREYLPVIPVDDRQLADDLTLRGIAVEGVFEVAGGTNGSLFEMDITTNRVDAMNHYGIAREAAAIYNVELKPLDVALPKANEAKPYPVKIEAADLCGRFTARVVRDVKIGTSTGVLAEYFAQLGQKLIFNAVDASNFVLLGMGHPTHAFDLDKLQGGIVVRRARKGEKIKLLDGTERVLESDDLVVADEKKAVGLAGVMGGWETMITAETKNILVEAAWFDPATIRRSSRRHGLHTDASHRFERGADFDAVPAANALVTKLILDLCGGNIEGELVDVVVPEAAAKTAQRAAISLSVAEVQRHLGTTVDSKGIGAAGIDSAIVEQYLTALGCGLEAAGDGTYSVMLPSWRLDIEREIDLIEEVARVYGYNRFANTLPAFAGAVVELPWEQKEVAVRRTLLALGFNEAVSSTFCAATDAELFSSAAVPMGNPLSEEAGMLRPSLLPGMLAMLEHNLNRGIGDVRLYESGTVFSGSTARVVERPSLALGATGAAAATALTTAENALFYEMKGAVELLAEKFAHATLTFSGKTPAWLEPGRGAQVSVDGVAVGWFGELSAKESQRRKFKQSVYIGELDLEKLYALPLRQPVSREVSRYPAVERDFSFLFADSVGWQQIADAINKLAIAEMAAPQPIEIFRDAKGNAVAAGQYSLLVRVVFQSAERTLRDEEITAWSERIVAALTALGGTLRA